MPEIFYSQIPRKKNLWNVTETDQASFPWNIYQRWRGEGEGRKCVIRKCRCNVRRREILTPNAVITGASPCPVGSNYVGVRARENNGKKRRRGRIGRARNANYLTSWPNAGPFNPRWDVTSFPLVRTTVWKRPFSARIDANDRVLEIFNPSERSRRAHTRDLDHLSSFLCKRKRYAKIRIEFEEKRHGDNKSPGISQAWIGIKREDAEPLCPSPPINFNIGLTCSLSLSNS